MDSLYEARGRIMEFYKERAIWVEIVFRFIVSLIVLFYINTQIGFMDMIDNVIVVIALSLFCSLIPMIGLVVISSVVMMLHAYSLSIVIAGIVALVSLVVYVFYFRFSSGQVIVLLFTPIALALDIPYALPIVFGLTGTLFTVIPMACGVVVYFVIQIMKEMSSDMPDDMIAIGIQFGKDLVLNKDMLALLIVLMVSTALVSSIKHIQIDHSWKYAVGSGVISNLLLIFVVSSFLDVKVSVVSIVIGNVVAVLLGLIIEFMLRSLEYKKTEYLECEDDEYYYYIKAIPKLGAKKKKVVRRTEKVKEVDVDEVYKRSVGSKVKEEKAKGIKSTVDESTRLIDADAVQNELNHNTTTQRKTPNSKHIKANYQLLKEKMKNELNL